MQIMGTALHFFVTGEEEDSVEAEGESSDESDAEARARRDMVLSRQTVKSGRKRQRKVAKARAILKVRKAYPGSFECATIFVFFHRSAARNSNHLHQTLWHCT